MVKGALILGVAIVLGVAIYVYYSPFQSCVRDYYPNSEIPAAVACARLFNPTG